MFFLAWLAGYCVWRKSQNRDTAGNPTTAGNLEAALKTGATVGGALFASGTFVIAGFALVISLQASQAAQDAARDAARTASSVSCQLATGPGPIASLHPLPVQAHVVPALSSSPPSS